MNSGLLLIDKPGGMTSHDVVGKCRRLLGRKDIGHAGTLDPMATGLLVILVGKATKLSDFILNGDKAYRTTVLLGTTTDTDDITGEVLSKKENIDVTLMAVEKAVEELTGEIELPVPIYSAIKVKGKKLYEKARKGEDFTPPMKTMEFKNIKLHSFENNRVDIEFQCTKGSYVRAWGKALGEKLGCGGTLESLRRVHSAPYGLEDSMTLSAIEEAGPEALESLSAWIPLSQTLPDWPLLRVEGQDEKLLSNGQISRRLERFLELEYRDLSPNLGVKVTSKRTRELVALLSFQPPLTFKIRRVFPR